MSARAADPTDAVAGELHGRGHVAHARVADVSDPDEVRELADWTARELGRIDVLVNDAGLGAIAPSEELSLELWERMVAVSLTGPLLCSQAGRTSSQPSPCRPRRAATPV